MPDSQKFLLDENIPLLVKQFLWSANYKAEYVPKGITNGKAVALSGKMKTVFLTRDSDFLNTSLFPPKNYSGIIVFVIHPPEPKTLASALALLLDECKEFSGKLFIVNKTGFKEIRGK